MIVGPKHGIAVVSQASRDPEGRDILVTQHRSYMICTIVYDAFAIGKPGLADSDKKDGLKNDSRDGGYLHWVLQYHIHYILVDGSKFSFDRRKQASHRHPFSESRRIAAKR